MAEYLLPPDILFQIFLNLPTKTLRRFLSVSKSWRSIITTNLFVSQHLIQPQHSQNNSFFFLKLPNYDIDKKYQQLSFSLIHKTHVTETQNQEIQNKETQHQETPSQYIYRPTGFDRDFRVSGIANGLILLTEDLRFGNSCSFLWNPAVDVFVKLPSPGITRKMLDMYAFGFWFDSRNCDFMLMRIVYRWNWGYDFAPLAEVYSLNTRGWRRVNVEDEKCNYMPSDSRSHVYLNGRSHWIGYRYDHFARLIMSFDMNDGVFREIILPFCCKYIPKITETMGCLAVIGDDGVGGVCRIWLMKKYGDLSSWTNLCNILSSNDLSNCRFQGLWKNGDVLLLRRPYQNYSSAQLVWYVPGSELLVEDFGIVLGGLSSTFSCTGIYEESLVLLDLKFSGECIDDNEYKPLVYQRG